MIALLYGSLLALLFVALSVRVILGRYKYRVSVGDGDNPQLRRRIRAQGNCAEYAPIGILMLALLETAGAAPAALHALGLLLLAGRTLHGLAFNLEDQWVKGRQAGMVMTFGALVSSALFGLALSLGL